MSCEERTPESFGAISAAYLTPLLSSGLAPRGELPAWCAYTAEARTLAPGGTCWPA